MAYPFKRVATCLNVLRTEINTRWPNRDTRSDGALGDQAHAARKSDHNPNEDGVVRARDFDEDGMDAPGVVEHLRLLGALGDKRLYPTGYLIYEKKICGAGSTQARWNTWRKYTGTNPHDHHFHVSCTQTKGVGGYDSSASWGIAGGHALQPTEASVFDIGSKGHAVEFINAALNWLAPYRISDKGTKGGQIPVVDEYTRTTKTAVKEFQRFCNQFLRFVGKYSEKTKIKEDGIVGPVTLKLMSDWTEVAFGKKK